MNIKNSFEFFDNNPDIYNIGRNSNYYSDYLFKKEEVFYINNLKKMFLTKLQNSGFKTLMEKYEDKIIFGKYNKNPLPAFLTLDGKIFINTKILKGGLESYKPVDITAMILYGSVLKKIIDNGKLKEPKMYEDYISNMFYTVFMKFYRKKYGLMKEDLQGTLAYILSLYVSSSLMGRKLDDNLRKEKRMMVIGSGKSFVENFNEDFDFTSIKETLACMRKNGIITISENKFSSDVIIKAGPLILPSFEDVPRFLANISAAEIRGNSIFTIFWKIMNPNLNDYLVKKTEKEIS